MGFADWRVRHHDLWQFISFNVLCNISTIARLACVWAGTAVFVDALDMTEPFSFLIFDYTAPGTNGVGGFVTFLVAEVLAQVVNFLVQFKLVFKTDRSAAEAAWKYAVLAGAIVVMNLLLPGRVTGFCQEALGLGTGVAGTLASVVNTLAAVVLSWPALKFWIMPDPRPGSGGAVAVKQ